MIHFKFYLTIFYMTLFYYIVKLHCLLIVIVLWDFTLLKFSVKSMSKYFSGGAPYRKINVYSCGVLEDFDKFFSNNLLLIVISLIGYLSSLSIICQFNKYTIMLLQCFYIVMILYDILFSMCISIICILAFFSPPLC